MPIATVADLVEALRTFHILSPGQLEKLGPVQATYRDPHSLARKLLDGGYITAYQINQLFKSGLQAELLLGPYVILQKLGEGGMGQVFKARNWKMNRIVALKVIRKERLGKPEAVQRFYREIRAAGQVDHPNVVLAFDSDEAAGTHFFAMEYVDGPSLSQLVKEKGPLPIDEACEYVRQIAVGLQHAHEKGLVHRDIKPSNLLVASGRKSPGTATGSGSLATPIVKILDMGLARLSPTGAESISSITQEGAVMGTPDFIAPEQMMDSSSVDIRADIYSLGCTFYYLLTGQVPFPGGSMGEKLVKHQFQLPRPVEQLRPEVPSAVAAIVNRLMAKRPEARYQTPLEVAQALEGVRAALLVAAPTVAVAAGAPIQPAVDPNVLSDWAAIAATSLGPSSRPGLGTSSAQQETVTSTTATDVGERAKPLVPHTAGGARRLVLLGVGIGGGLGLVGIAAALFLLPGSSADTRAKATPSQAVVAPTQRAVDEPHAPVFLADLQETDLHVWNKKFGTKGQNEAGERLTINGAAAPHALFLHPPSKGKAQVSYKLDKKFKEFTCGVGLADSAGSSSATPLTFIISADGWVLWKSAPVQKPGELQQCSVPLVDRVLLKLEVDCPGSNGNAHAVFIDPQAK